jgi:hypothetical protein
MKLITKAASFAGAAVIGLASFPAVTLAPASASPSGSLRSLISATVNEDHLMYLIAYNDAGGIGAGQSRADGVALRAATVAYNSGPIDTDFNHFQSDLEYDVQKRRPKLVRVAASRHQPNARARDRPCPVVIWLATPPPPVSATPWF